MLGDRRKKPSTASFSSFHWTWARLQAVLLTIGIPANRETILLLLISFVNKMFKSVHEIMSNSLLFKEPQNSS